MATQRSNQRTDDRTDREKGDPPVWSRRLWTGSANVEVAVFEKEVRSDSGDFTAYNVSAKRVYKQDDEYKPTQGFRGEDVPHLISLLSQAHAYICEQMNKR